MGSGIWPLVPHSRTLERPNGNAHVTYTHTQRANKVQGWEPGEWARARLVGNDLKIKMQLQGKLRRLSSARVPESDCVVQQSSTVPARGALFFRCAFVQ